jgi:hypothetical protein
LLEVGYGALQPKGVWLLVVACVLDRNQPGSVAVVLRLNDEVGQPPRLGVDHDILQPPEGTVAAGDRDVEFDFHIWPTGTRVYDPDRGLIVADSASRRVTRYG